MIAAKVINGLMGTLKEMRDPDHPWRDEANALIEKLIERPCARPRDARARRGSQTRILANPVFAEQAQALWEELEASLRNDLPRHARSDRRLGGRLARRTRPRAQRGRSAPREDQPVAQAFRASRGAAAIAPKSRSFYIADVVDPTGTPPRACLPT